MGFSLIGFIIVISILTPNFLFIAFPPQNIPIEIKDTAIILTIAERIGQGSCMLLLVISKTNFEETNINIWFFLMIVCISFYYFLWIRYFVQGRTYSTAFKSLGFIPVPMAIFPVLAFGFAAIWGKSIWLGISVIILAFGHITNSWIIYQYTKQN
ncbi:hypothetical protein ACTHO0_01955 [Cytobacillus praedii]|uniref:hypothetical protein n=1 Tax=Cytobacillus praedii TaxID=1742358 RepID=UPI003F803334